MNRYKVRTADAKFDRCDNALDTIDGKISLADVKNNQDKSKSNLGEIKRGNNKKRSKEQKSTLHNIKMLFKASNGAIKFFDDCSSIMSEAKARLPIALAQVKHGNNSESLLNEIRQIVHSFFQSKQITKKVYDNIIKSIP